MEKVELKVGGMSCKHCEAAVVEALAEIGVKAEASHEDNKVVVEFNSSETGLDAIKSQIAELEYSVIE